MTDITAADLVTAGTVFLDKIDKSWPDLIDLQTLDLGDPQSCVIGQTFCHQLFRNQAKAAGVDPMIDGAPTQWQAGQWALSDLEGDDATAPDFGFDSYWDAGTQLVVGYAELDEAWREVIAERQANV